jgi:hypothetical protein
VESSQPGSVSRSVALPPKVWDTAETISAEHFRNNRSAYILALINADVTHKDGKLASHLVERKTAGKLDSPAAIQSFADELTAAIVPKLTEQLTTQILRRAEEKLSRRLQEEDKRSSDSEKERRNPRPHK